MIRLAVRSRRLVTPEGLLSAALLIENGLIVDVATRIPRTRSIEIVDVGDLAVLPGAVDVHVHINEPGRTDWEGFASATRAAAAGGVTTVVDMPLNSSPVTVDPAALEAKISAARGQLHVDCAFHGGVVPGNAGQLEPLARAGVVAFKAFLVHSGIDDFPAAGEPELRAALEVCRRWQRPLFAHAELPLPAPAMDDARSYGQWLASRPAAFEVEAIALLIRLARELRDAPLHVVHLACADALPLLREARAEGLPLTCETCPHYLTFAAEEIPDGDPRFKCAPPIRTADHREALWAALAAGTIDWVASDHSPAPPGLKHLDDGDVRAAWGGIASLQLLVPATWTGAVARGHDLEDLTRWLCTRPAAGVGLAGRKGALALGADADFFAFDPEAEWTVRGAELQHRHPATPYEGRRLRGVVERAWQRGHRIYDRRRGLFAAPAGEVILRR